MRELAQNVNAFWKNSRIWLCTQIVTMLYWMVWIRKSDAYYVIYLLIGVAGILAFFDNQKKNRIDGGNRRWVLIAASVMFALITLAANYKLVLSAPMPDERATATNICYTVVMTVSLFLGGAFTIWNLLMYLVDSLMDFYWKQCEYHIRPVIVWTTSMAAISCVYLQFFFARFYPGILTPDSIWQIKQTMSNIYSNHHPFAHTMVIKIIIGIGMRLFGDINKATALYSVCQIAFMAGVFSYVIVTLYQMKISRKWIIGCLVWYALMPYHIMYSFTMWKDVAFGGLVTIFITATFRILRGIGKNQIKNYAIAFVGSMGMCLFRSNGWFAFLITTVIFMFMYGRHKKELLSMFSIVLILSFILLHPVLEYLDVEQPDIIEALSVPAQQIARVITDCNDLTEEQMELLNKIVNTEEISSVYLPYISDPVKTIVREKGNQDYLVEHKMDYAMLWIEIGISHMKEYFEAWVDLTKGYWNGGYDYVIWSSGVAQNDLGIVNSVKTENERGFGNTYFWLYSHVPFLQLFISIGLFSWIVMGACVMGMFFNRRDTVFLTVPLIAVIFSLLIATPVYAEFRYAYAIFTSVPMILFSIFIRQE